MSRIPITYVWASGDPGPAAVPLRHKTRYPEQAKLPKSLLKIDSPSYAQAVNLAIWSYDASSTGEAEGHDSDNDVTPVLLLPDPFLRHQGERHALIAYCGVPQPKRPGEVNTRDLLVEACSRYERYGWQFGIEQEYTAFDAGTMLPIAFPREGEAPAAPQGRFYCGVGAECVDPRLEHIIYEHASICDEVGLAYWGNNPEVMQGQAEFQSGPLSPLEAADQRYVMLYMLKRVAARFRIMISCHPKPVKPWNGAGAHTNASTKGTRGKNGAKAIDIAIERIAASFPEITKVLGVGTEWRLTGIHETARYGEFTSGARHRGAAVRVPGQVQSEGRGYFEFRPPSANCDTHLVLLALMDAVSGDGFRASDYGLKFPKAEKVLPKPLSLPRTKK